MIQIAQSTLLQGALQRRPLAEGGNDDELLARIRSGDEGAYEDMFRQFGPRMMLVARGILWCEQDCADALQDAFLSAFQGIGAFAGNAALGTWLQRIVINACRMKLRSKARRPAVSIHRLLSHIDEDESPTARLGYCDDEPARKVDVAETRALVRRCIDSLPDIHRTVLLLRDINELDSAETAQQLGTSSGAVKIRLHRARKALRTLLNRSFATDLYL